MEFSGCEDAVLIVMKASASASCRLGMWEGHVTGSKACWAVPCFSILQLDGT